MGTSIVSTDTTPAYHNLVRRDRQFRLAFGQVRDGMLRSRAFQSTPMRFAMMHDMMSGMMWGMGLISVLGVIVLALGAAALIKYLILSNRRH